MSFDLSQFDTVSGANEGANLELRGPDGKRLLTDNGKPWTITVCGADSDRYRKAQRRLTNRRLAQSQGKRNAKLSAEELEEDAIWMLAECTTGWFGLVLDGQPLDCTVDNAAMVYTRFPWIKEQVDTFIAERENFLPHAANS